MRNPSVLLSSKNIIFPLSKLKQYPLSENGCATKPSWSLPDKTNLSPLRYGLITVSSFFSPKARCKFGLVHDVTGRVLWKLLTSHRHGNIVNSLSSKKATRNGYRCSRTIITRSFTTDNLRKELRSKIRKQTRLLWRAAVRGFQWYWKHSRHMFQRRMSKRQLTF